MSSCASRGCDQLRPFTVEPPYSLELDVLDTAIADAAAIMPGAGRPGPRTLSYEAVDVHTVFRALLALIKLGGTVV